MRFHRLFLDSVVAAAALCSSALPLTTVAAPSAAGTNVAQARAQIPGVHRYRVGDFQVTALSDGTVPQDLHELLRGTSPAEVDKMLHHAFLSNPVEASITAFLIDTGSRLILVDTGAGGLFGPGHGGKLLGSLKVAGYEPEQIDDILLTHIHTDHSGGLVSEGNRVFPNATVHVGKPDLDFFLNPANQGGVNGYDKKYFEQAVKTVGPYMKAGKVQAFTRETQLFPGIKAIPTPGHTPGHAFYRVESRGNSITFIGDIVHVASVQFPKTAITIVYDVSPKDAAAQREAQFAAAASNRALVAAPHLPYPGIGHIRAEERGYTFVPVDYRDRHEP
ncbi:MBL fold metallo-hydrolase [Cystobacter ferrugineus]|uniref:MBL fold metallo-hydrolase n=1 Tax=Cystobacter ferrugineus TaxID=83449 RepID=A0A1L9BEG0_9BACT|nr:MBL fold metallo-hydrolase [Cystobacter ferrugineus]OJH40626.1 MBL fold metallo-hydrolase [Cystobacter ferrugineus]